MGDGQFVVTIAQLRSRELDSAVVEAVMLSCHVWVCFTKAESVVIIQNHSQLTAFPNLQTIQHDLPLPYGWVGDAGAGKSCQVDPLDRFQDRIHCVFWVCGGYGTNGAVAVAACRPRATLYPTSKFGSFFPAQRHSAPLPGCEQLPHLNARSGTYLSGLLWASMRPFPQLLCNGTRYPDQLIIHPVPPQSTERT